MKAPWKETTMRLAYLGAVVGASLVVGCGGGDDDESNADRFEGAEREVAALLDDFAEAGRDGDGARVCDEIFAVALSRTVEDKAEQSCESEIQDNLPKDEYELEVESVDVKGETAQADVTDQDGNRSVFHAVKSGDAWRILRIDAR